jgi:membrane-associated protein
VEILSEAIFAVAQSPWAFVLLAALLIVDGFFPLVPGETTVIALATLGASGHGPHPAAVLGVAILATAVGDSVAFWIGRSVGTSRWRWMRHARAMRARRWAANHIERTPGRVLVGAKFLPYARVAVTMTAGGSRLPARTFVFFSVIAASVYTVFHVVIGSVTGTIFASNPVMALVTSVALGLIVAGLIGVIAQRISRRRASSAHLGG